MIRLRRFTKTATVIACVMLTACAASQDTLYTGAMVWNGRDFERRDIGVREARFISPHRLSGRARHVDLSDRYVVPAYVNAHHHITEPNARSDWSFQQHGVYYVWNPNMIWRESWADDALYFQRRETIELRTGFGGITEPGGHPEQLYVEVLARYVYPGLTLDDFLGVAFHYGRTHSEIDAALDRLHDQGAQFVKIFLLASENYIQRRDDQAYYGSRGMNPENVGYVTAGAHARGLRVVAHVQTVHDLRVALAAGVDMLAHLPGYSATRVDTPVTAFVLNEDDAEQVATLGTLVVPTYAFAATYYAEQDAEGTLDTAARNALFHIQAHNLRLLSNAGARIVPGTDAATSIFSEIEHWIAIDGLTHQQALAIALNSASVLFARERVGRLAPGYYADFLALTANPSDDIVHLASIELRIKHGEVILPPDCVETPTC